MVGWETIFTTGNRPKGITLVEILVVLGVIGLMVGLSLPSLIRYAQHSRLRASVRQVLGILALARSSAISTNEEHWVLVDEKIGVISLQNSETQAFFEKKVSLPQSVSVRLEVGGEPAEESQLTFRTTGGLSGRTVVMVLTGSEKERRITITGATGSVTVE